MSLRRTFWKVSLTMWATDIPGNAAMELIRTPHSGFVHGLEIVGVSHPVAWAALINVPTALALFAIITNIIWRYEGPLPFCDSGSRAQH